VTGLTANVVHVMHWRLLFPCVRHNVLNYSWTMWPFHQLLTPHLSPLSCVC